MAISSYKIYLMGWFAASSGDAGEWRKLVDIKDFPDLIEPPEQLETTTLSNRNRTYIPGIQQSSDKTFTCNYSKSDYDRLVNLKDHLYGYAVWMGGTEDPHLAPPALEASEDGTTQYAVWFGATVAGGVATPTGSEGKFGFIGYLSPSVSGAGVNEVVNMVVTITPASDISDDGTLDWGYNTPAQIPNSDAGELGSITITSVAGTAVGDTNLTTNYSLGEDESYVYKIGDSAPVINYFNEPDFTWTAWDGTANTAVGAANNGKKITVAVLNAQNLAIKAGSQTLVVKTT